MKTRYWSNSGMISIEMCIINNMPVLFVSAIKGYKDDKMKGKFSGTKLDRNSRTSIKLQFDDIIDLRQSLVHESNIAFMRNNPNKTLNVAFKQGNDGKQYAILAMNGVGVKVEPYKLLAFIDFALDVVKQYIKVSDVTRRNLQIVTNEVIVDDIDT